MKMCEVIDECPDDTYPVVMQYCVNQNLYETHRNISEHDIETNWDAMKIVLEEPPDDYDDEYIKKVLGKKIKFNRQSYY